MKKIIIIALVAISMAVSSYSQVMELEKTYTITGENKVDINPFVQTDPNTRTYVVRFFIKQKNDVIKSETYFFDQDFNFIKNDKDEIKLSNIKLKFPWLDYKGDQFELTGITADENDKLVLRKKTLTVTYNWYTLSYNMVLNDMGKEKFKTNEGEGYVNFRNWDQNNSYETLYVLCGMNDKSDKFKYCKDFKLLKIDKEMKVIKELSIKFDFPQDIVYPRFADAKTETRNNSFDKEMIIVFAPKNEGSSVSDKNKTNFTFIKINDNLELIDRIPFNSISTGWSIEDKIIDTANNDVYFFGGSLKGKDKYFDDLKDTKKFDGFQIMKVSDHNISYIKEYSLYELSKKLIKAPSQKESTPYEGKKFRISAYTLTANKNLIIVGQNWANRPGGSSTGGRAIGEYFDSFGLGFDNSGNFLGQYMYRVGHFAQSSSPTSQYLFKGKDPNNVYWFLIDPENMAGYLVTSYFAKIDLKNSTLSNFSNFQFNKKNKPTYYLNTKTPFILTSDNKIVLVGGQFGTKGKTIWFARLKLD
jgi:hypothetical protein